MKKEYRECEICGKRGYNEKQLRRENWLEIHGDCCQGISVWLEKPRSKNGSFMITVGYEHRDYDFCSIACLAKALKGKKSI